MKRPAPAILAVIFLVATAFAAEPRIETIGPFTGEASAAIKSALSEAGYRVTGEDGKVLAEIWPAKSPASLKSADTNALYPDFVSGAFYGVISFPGGAGDFRGQKIPAGTYTLRYQLLPGDGNHMGVAPNPDFFLLSPIASDADPAAKIPYAALVRLSAKAAGTAHPAAFALSASDQKSPAVTQDQGHVIANVSLHIDGGSKMVGIILTGSAE